MEPTEGAVTRRSLALGAGVTAVMVVVLRLMGRSWWCRCGQLAPWSGQIWSEHNSQHLVDPYVFTHMLHGVVFFAVLRLVLGADRLFPKFAVALVIEAAWEIAENTPMVIDRYRESTVSLGYQGDSIVNSMGDLWACALGFWFATRVSWKVSLATFVAVELALLLAIRDSLVVNVIMLVWPIEAIKQWQLAGAPLP